MTVEEAELREAFDLLVNSAVEDLGPDLVEGGAYRVLIRQDEYESVSVPIPRVTYDAIMKVLLRRSR